MDETKTMREVGNYPQEDGDRGSDWITDIVSEKAQSRGNITFFDKAWLWGLAKIIWTDNPK